VYYNVGVLGNKVSDAAESMLTSMYVYGIVCAASLPCAICAMWSFNNKPHHT